MHRDASVVRTKGASFAVAGIVLALALLGPVAAAPAAGGGPGSGPGGEPATYVAPGLLAQGDQAPDRKIRVIVQSVDGTAAAEQATRGLGSLGKRLDLVGGVSLELPAGRVRALAKMPGLTVTRDALVAVSGTSGFSSSQIWPYASGVSALWGLPAAAPQGPAIAVVDSGIDAGRVDFGSRVLAQVNLSSLTPGATGDGRGHGTFVAGIAAGSAPGYAGAAPNAPLVSIRVMDDKGRALTSDVIAACDWILQNKAKYNIRVANFSLHAATPTHFVNSPLDRAVEKLWFSGVVVVAAAGNFGVASQQVRMAYAPGNDPFAITVGAADLGGTIGVGNDTAAPFSAYGYTYDGFLKPDLAAPGRYLVGPVPVGSTLAVEKASNVTAPGYIQLSGTSFAAPVVSGVAQAILTRHPAWTPDQVKGALLATARQAPNAARLSLGAGEVNGAKAASVSAPANPNRALEAFVTSDPSGGKLPVFAAASWESAVKQDRSWDAASWADASWTDASWTDASWTDASWTDASWTDASWTDASWTDASWTDASWTDASWTDASWTDASWTDAAEGDSSTSPGAYTISASDLAVALG